MCRSNLIFEGCTESENENTTGIVERPRPIIVRFVRHSVRDYVFRSANKLKDYHEEIFINEDLPAFTKSRRAELRLIMQNAKAEGVAAKQTEDKVTVAGQTYDYKNIDCLPTKYSMESASTKAIGEEIIGFYSKHSPLSNFRACTFEVDNV